MTYSYVYVKVSISDGQKAKIKKALSTGADSISIRLKPENFSGNDLIALTNRQANKLAKVYESGK